MRFFILLTLFLSSSILLFSCCSPKALEYRDVSAFSISKLGITSSTVNMNIVYYNPNLFSMQLKRTDLDIFIDSNYVGHTTQQNQVTIPAQSEFNIPLTVDINMNTIFQSMLANSVWKNYMLISTQWPSAFGCTSLKSRNPSAADPKNDFHKQPDMTCSPAPTFMANSTLETYSQGEVPIASSSCIACHGNAVGFQRTASNPQPGKPNLNQSDFTFILEKAQ